MLVKIINSGNLDGPHYTYNDPHDYIVDGVVDFQRKKALFATSDATYDISHLRLTRADNSVTEITANHLVYVCTDDGKTIEKIAHECQSQPPLNNLAAHAQALKQQARDLGLLEEK